MANLRILFRNLVDTATVTASPALASGNPETNLQDQRRKKTARSTSTASQELRFSWSSAQTVNMAATRYHNLTASAQLAAPTYSDSAFTTSIDANAAANCFAYTGLDANDVLTEADFRILKNTARYLTERSNVQSMKLTITDAANPDGYFDISRVFIGKALTFTYNPPWGGVPLAIEDLSENTDMADGSIVTDKREKRRRIDLNLEWVAEAQLPALLAGLRLVGKDKDIWVSCFPEDGTYLEPYYQGAFKIVENAMVSRHLPSLAQTKLTLVET